jgi:hypothetical protein
VAPPRVELKDHLGTDEPNGGYSLRSGGPVGVLPPALKPVSRDTNEIPTRTVRFEDQVGPTHQTQPNPIMGQDGVVQALERLAPAPQQSRGVVRLHAANLTQGGKKPRVESEPI